jgi:drug/metabolite transporter (DMT)-like permease
MTDTQPLAVGLALAGSGCYAVAVVTQQRVTARLRSEQAFDTGVLRQLIRRPAWLAGLAAVIAGFVLQAAALGLGRLVLVEPVLASGLLFALALAAWRDRRPLRAVEWAAALAAVAGVAVFVGAGQPAGGQRTASSAALGITAVAVAALVILCRLLIGRVPASRRALLLGLAGGAAAGANDAVTKSVAVVASGHHVSLFTDPRLYLLAVVGLLTFTIQQNGYRAGALTAFLPAFAVIEAVSGSLLGLVIYEERLSDRPAQIVIEVVASLAAGWGIARLARPATGTEPPAVPAKPAGPVGPAAPATAPAPVAVPPAPAAPPAPIAASSAEEA